MVWLGIFAAFIAKIQRKKSKPPWVAVNRLRPRYGRHSPAEFGSAPARMGKAAKPPASRCVTASWLVAHIHQNLIAHPAMVPFLLVMRPGAEQPPPRPVPVCWVREFEDGIGVTTAFPAPAQQCALGCSRRFSRRPATFRPNPTAPLAGGRKGLLMLRFTPSAGRSAGIAAGVGGVLVAVQLCGAAAASAATLPSVLAAIKQCESGGNYTAVNPTSGASGAYQFLTSTWQSLSASAGYATAAAAPPAVQDAAALELYNEDGTTPWASSESCWGSAATASSSSSGSAASSSSLTAAASSAAPAVTPPTPSGPALGYGRGPGGWDPAAFTARGTGVRLCPSGGPGPRH